MSNQAWTRDEENTKKNQTLVTLHLNAHGSWLC